jgi:hypothetical protein
MTHELLTLPLSPGVQLLLRAGVQIAHGRDAVPGGQQGRLGGQPVAVAHMALLRHSLQRRQHRLREGPLIPAKTHARCLPGAALAAVPQGRSTLHQELALG